MPQIDADVDTNAPVKLADIAITDDGQGFNILSVSGPDSDLVEVSDGALLRALHPTPAVCGVPTARARAFLREVEPFDRGLYTGPIGCFGRDASEVAVALRCATLRGHWIQLFAGAGIVEGSEADAEWQETQDKMQMLVDAIEAVDAR